MDGYGVEVETLVSTGEKFSDLADEAAEALAEFAGKVEVHDGSNEGFATSSKASSLAQQWEFQIDDLSKRTSVAGGLLQEGADSYQQMERTVIETLPPLSSTD